MLPLRQEGAPRGRLPGKAVQSSGQGNATRGEREGQRLESRGAVAPQELASKALVARTAEQEAVCRCIGGCPGGSEDVAVRVQVGKDTLWVPLDTGARSLWVDREWFEDHSGVWEAEYSCAVTADGKDMVVCGKGQLSFRLWGGLFTESVRVASRLPSRILLGSRFWTRHGLLLNLGLMTGKIAVEGR